MNLNIFVNGIKISIPEGTTLKDIMNRFFRARCEFVISINSDFVQDKRGDEIVLNENDKLRVIAYSRHSYQPQKRTVFKDENEKEKKI